MIIRMRLKLSVFITFLICSCATIPLNELDEAIQKGDLKAVITIIEKDSRPLNAKDITGRTPLHNATELGYVEIIQYLIKQGADVNSTSTRTIKTPLHIAVTDGNLEIVKYLVSNGAKINVKDFDGNTPLHKAIYFLWDKESELHNFEMLKYLVDSGANVNSTNYINKETPLHMAAFLGLHETTKYLVEHHAAVDAKNINGNTPLYDAASKGHLKIVKYLVSKGSNIRATNKYKATPFHYAASSGNKELVEYLISKGVNIEAKDNNGRTPLDYARQMSKIEIIEILNLKLKSSDKNYLSQIKKETKKNIVFQKDDEKSETFLEKSKPSIPAIDFGQYFALIIGNNNYRYLKRLKTATNDAQEVSNILKYYYGYKVDRLIDATRSDILLAFGELRGKLTPEDNLLIYYAGHGWMDQESDEGYWLPVDATEDNIVNWVSNSSITNMLKAIQAKHILVVADSCYSGKLSRGIHKIDRTPGYLSRISEKKARSVLSSGGLEPVMDEGGKGNHSVFASTFIEALKENTGIMDGTTLFSKIRRPIMLNSDQTPEYSDIRKAGHDGGDFLFVRIR